MNARAAALVGDGRKPFKVNQLYLLRGKDHIRMRRSACRGHRCAGQDREIAFDSVLHDSHDEDHIHIRADSRLPTPIYGIAIEATKRGDEQRLWEILQKLASRIPA